MKLLLSITLYLLSITTLAQHELHIVIDTSIVLSDKKHIAHLYTVTPNSRTDSSKIGIELHGKSSRLHPKKNYEFEFRTQQNKEVSKTVFGMTPGDDFVLISMAYDGSYMRNTLVFELWKQLGYWSPDYRYVQLFWNEEYHGLYLLCEKVKAGRDRVNIKSHMCKDNFLIKMGRYNYGDYDFSGYPDRDKEFLQDTRYKIVYPKTKNLDYRERHQYSRKLSGISNDLIQAFDSTTTEGSGSLIDETKSTTAHINLNSFIDYFLLSEITKNPDAYLANLYLLNQCQTQYSYEFSIGPQWDYDLAFANTNQDFFRADSGWTFIHNAIHSGDFANTWWQDLSDIDAFKDSCSARLKEVKHVFSESNIRRITDSLMLTIIPLHKADYALWKVDSTVLPDNIKPQRDLLDEHRHLLTFVSKRMDWIGANIIELPKFSSPFNELMQKSKGEQLATNNNKMSLHYPPYKHSGRYSRVGYYTYEILDFNGSLLSKGSFPKHKKTFDLSSYPKGTYFIHIEEHYGSAPGSGFDPKNPPLMAMPTYSDVYFYENAFYSFVVE